MHASTPKGCVRITKMVDSGDGNGTGLSQLYLIIMSYMYGTSPRRRFRAMDHIIEDFAAMFRSNLKIDTMIRKSVKR